MRLLSPRELADALGVSESSLKRWVDAGKIAAARTEGGHRRIALPEAVRFIRESGAHIARPELLDMPEVHAVRGAARGEDAFRHYLVEGDAQAARGWLLSRYLAGENVAAMCDGPVRAAMHAIGELWQHDAEGVFIEHRATDLCIQALSQLRATFDPPASAPLALGATPEADPYLLPSFMAALVIASVGVRAINLGPDTPTSALDRAVAHHQPQLVWISASSTVARPAEISEWLAGLPPTTIAVVGGRRGHEIASPLRAESMVDLARIAQRLVAPAVADGDLARG